MSGNVEPKTATVRYFRKLPMISTFCKIERINETRTRIQDVMFNSKVFRKLWLSDIHWSKSKSLWNNHVALANSTKNEICVFARYHKSSADSLVTSQSFGSHQKGNCTYFLITSLLCIYRGSIEEFGVSNFHFESTFVETLSACLVLLEEFLHSFAGYTSID